ncbi:MAG: nucleotidyl transferase AbiEii/AbiGii toxin family protein [candidate division WOR-3 bacterium]
MDYKKINLIVELLKILQIIDKIDNDFLLKGGTAINLFYRDLPRLSVDIDLVFNSLVEREQAVIKNNKFFDEFEKSLWEIMKYKITSKNYTNNFITKIIINSKQGPIKIEPNCIVRGTLNGFEKKTLSNIVYEKTNIYVTFNCLNKKELYASKICAALDRQHPRDLYDIFIMLKEENINDIDFETLFYILQSNRPLSEIFDPQKKDISNSYKKNLTDLMLIEVSLKDLNITMQKIIDWVQKSVFLKYYDFLLSFAEGNPDFKKLKIDISMYPGIEWKILNIKKMKKEKIINEIKSLKKLKSKLI